MHIYAKQNRTRGLAGKKEKKNQNQREEKGKKITKGGLNDNRMFSVREKERKRGKGSWNAWGGIFKSKLAVGKGPEARERQTGGSPDM